MKTHKLFFTSVCFVVLAAVPGCVNAADLVNINTADLATLDTLPGVGSSIAQSIIDNRPYASIEEISRVSGIGEPGSSSYEDIKNRITVSDSSTPSTTQTQASTTIVTKPPPLSFDAGSTLPIVAHITGDTLVMVGGGSYFSGAVFGAQGLPLQNARYVWNFGDGTTAEGHIVFHAYSYPGKYVVSLDASSGFSTGFDRTVVEAVPAQVALVAEADGSLSVFNKSQKDMSVGLWTLTNGPSNFVIPKNTTVLARGGVRFSFAVTRVVGDTQATLLYPNKAVAAAADPSADSPLRGEPISMETPRSISPVVHTSVSAQPAGLVLAAETGGTSTQSATNTPIIAGVEDTIGSAAVAKSGAGVPLWVSFLGLAGVLALGLAGVWYVRSRIPARVSEETTPDGEEFDIE
ncbi:MAG: helix-hairpin-helix domain-containing protein [bacterium]|nr:helix-hairpin-helix domain-containing protein [bacterium]